MRHLDLFSGIGGFALAARWVGWETIAFCEIDEFCRDVLKKHWPNATYHCDVRNLNGREYKGSVDIITGGYPCQPFSLAGKRRGEADDRHLWPEFARIIQEVKPRWVVGENVAGHISMGLDSVLFDLEGLGYTWEAFVIPACAVSAPHRRDRVWIVAHTASSGKSDGTEHEGEECGELGAVADTDDERISAGYRKVQEKNGEVRQRHDNAESGNSSNVSDAHGTGIRANARTQPRTGAECPQLFQEDWQSLPDDAEQVRATMADTEGTGLEGWALSRDARQELTGSRKGGRSEPGRWCAESGVGRVAHGIPRRVDRIRGLGNAIVPQVAEVIFRAIDKADA